MESVMSCKECKVIEHCQPCNCCSTDGLSTVIDVPRPTERVIVREIVQVATPCAPDCNCDGVATE